MSINTEDDRRSVMSLNPAITMLPRPDNLIGSADRQQVSWVYRGILSQGGIPEPDEIAGKELIIGVI